MGGLNSAMLSVALPRRIITGGGAVRELGPLLKSMGFQRPLVIADEFLASPQSGAVDKVKAALSEMRDVDVFTDTIPDPTTESVARCVDALGARSYDCVVALGGLSHGHCEGCRNAAHPWRHHEGLQSSVHDG